MKMAEAAVLPSTEKTRKKELIKARWGILRNALLQNSQQNQQQLQHSIHRFSGYSLIQARSGVSASKDEWDIRRLEPLLTEFRWDCLPNECSKQNIDRLEIAILALAACFPKGKCMKITFNADPNICSQDMDGKSSVSDLWLEPIKHRCQPCVRVWKVSEEPEESDETKEGVSSVKMVTTLLVQESSASTKYQTLFYDLDDQKNVTDLKSVQNENKENDGGDSSTIDGSQACHNHTIWTREPRENRLSLDDLVSHRKNNGVDNTGNICVWDSERTLAYLVYHHFDDFPTQIEKNKSEIRILELGTGMAGLSALALGFRLAKQQDENGDKMNTMEKIKDLESKKKSIYITLTDGNPSGVKNNAVNQFLTKLNSEMVWKEMGKYSHYLDLDVNCKTLLWTTDLETTKDDITNQDIILVSDCVHFQNFHAALATTSLRCLRVGASAIFCQPTRGPSLNNFYNLLLTATSESSESSIGSTSLLSCTWISHPVIDQKHNESKLNFDKVYDDNLHHPKLLVVTKLREISEEDQARFMAYQSTYSPIKRK